MKGFDLIYPEHKHPHCIENKPVNKYRIWVCEECGHIFTDGELRGGEKAWGHPCGKARCESHLEPYIPDFEPAPEPQEEEKAK